MDFEVSPIQINTSLLDNDEPSMSINEPSVVEEEDEMFYDAGETTHSSSDTTPPNLKFSIANEDLPTDASDQSELDIPVRSARKPRDESEPFLENLDDISTEGASSTDENNSPQVRRPLSLYDENNELEENFQILMINTNQELPEIVTPFPLNQDIVEKQITDAPGILESISGENNESQSDGSYVLCIESSKSSMEVMEDDSDAGSSKSGSSVKPETNSNAANGKLSTEVVVDKNVLRETCKDSTKKNDENSASIADLPVKNAGPDENDVSSANVCSKENDANVVSAEEIFESVTPVDSKPVEPSNKTNISEPITIDEESDIDESLQENLDAALKVVEESPLSSPSNTSLMTEKTDIEEKADDSVGQIDDLLQQIETNEETKNILQELREDPAQEINDTTEIIDDRLSPCQVVLFRIDFEEYGLNLHKNGSGSAQSSSSRSNSSVNSDSDIPFSRSSRTSRKSAIKKTRPVKKSVKKIYSSSSESSKEILSPRSRNTRVTLTATEAIRRFRRPVKNIFDSKNHSKVGISSSDSDSDLPLSRLKKRKCTITTKTTKHLNRIVNKKISPSKRTIRQNIGNEKIASLENSKIVEISRQKTLRCVSVPIITGIIESLKENSYREWLEATDEKMELRTETLSKCGSRRRKLSSSEISKSLVENGEYKIYSKMWKDHGTSRENSSFSLRSNLKVPSNKVSLRKRVRAQNYIETSGIDTDDESSLEKSEKRSKKNSNNVRQHQKNNKSNGAEIGETDKRYPRRRNVQSTSLRSRN